MCIANSQKLVLHCLYKEQKYRNCIFKIIIIYYFYITARRTQTVYVKL